MPSDHLLATLRRSLCLSQPRAPQLQRHKLDLAPGLPKPRAPA